MEKASQEQILCGLKKLIMSLPEPEQRRIYYVLDYVLNYHLYERIEPRLEMIDFRKEFTQLKSIGVIIETYTLSRGKSRHRLQVNYEVKEEISKLLREKYYPIFEERIVTEKLRETIVKYFSEATILWFEVKNSMKQGNEKRALMLYDRILQYRRNAIEFGKELAKSELGYFVIYNNYRYTDYEYCFIFRSEPIDIQALFLKIIEEELVKIFTSPTPAMEWCVYLKRLFPGTDERFLLNNRPARFTPAEIKEAINKLPDIEIEKLSEIEKIRVVVQKLIEKERTRVLYVIKNFLNRDPSVVKAIGTLNLLAEEKERYLNINNLLLLKINEAFPYSYEKLRNYTKILSDFGLIFTSNKGDLIIPKMLEQVFDEALRGGALELKIFEGPLDGDVFIEETMAKATSNIKIWDPYVSTKTLRIIEKSIKPKSVCVEILSSIPEVVEEILTLSMKKGIRIRAKIVYKKNNEKNLSPFHDRYLIVDDRNVWHFGPSLHAAGEKPWETASLLPEHFTKVIIDAFLYNFCRNTEEWKQDGYQAIEKDYRVIENELESGA